MPFCKHVVAKFRVPLMKPLNRDKVGHGEVTINNAATVDGRLVMANNDSCERNISVRN